MFGMKVIVLAMILSGPLLLNVSSRRTRPRTRHPRPSGCNITEKCPRPVFCPLINKIARCKYLDYLNDYCSCCKRCTYPPPSNVRCRKSALSPVACTLFLYNKCTPDMYIEELCQPCQHCPSTPQPEDTIKGTAQVTHQALDPCFSSPCPAGYTCVNDPKQCVTTPCDQYLCLQPNPCATIKCSSGYRCAVIQQCSGNVCGPAGLCVKDASQQVIPKTCPLPTVGGDVSTCQFTDCSRSGCPQGQLCCPQGCGGTSCQIPI